MQARIKWIEKMRFAAQSGSGHAQILDAAQEDGGDNAGPTPMELLLMGAGGCASMDVVSILKRGRHDVRDCVTTLDADCAEQDPQVFTRIHLHFVVTGQALTTAAVERAVTLSAEKYCCATQMLGRVATITRDFEIIAL
jgi:putative redox protein